MRDQVFISYSHKDARWLERLQVHLAPFERAGRIARWDDTRIEAGSRWHDEIVQALDHAKVAVLLVSADFLASRFIAEEELPRLLAAAENEGVVILSLVLGACAFDRVEGLSQYHSINPPSQPLIELPKAKRERHFVALARAVEQTLGAGGATPSDAPDSGRLCGVPSRNPLFCARHQLIDVIEAALTRGVAVALHGLYGMGKSEIAIEIAYRRRMSHSVVFWLRAESQSQLHADLVVAATSLRLPEASGADEKSIAAATLRWLREHSGWLAILDDVGDLSWTRELLALAGQGRVLITAVAPTPPSVADAFAVDALAEEDASEYLLRRCRILRSGEPLGQVDARQRDLARYLCAELGGVPLAIEQAGAYVEETGCSLEQYLKLWESRRSQLLARAADNPVRVSPPLATTWSMVIAELRHRQPLAFDLLRLLSYLHHDDIPEDMLTEGANAVGGDLAPLLADAWSLNEALRESIRLALLRRDAKSGSLRLHRLMQTVVRESMDTASRTDWSRRAVALLAATFPEPKFDTWPRCARLLANAMACAEAIHDWRFASEDAALLLERSGYYLYQRGRYPEALPLAAAAADMRRTLFGAGDVGFARAIGRQAQVELALGRFDAAEVAAAHSLRVLQSGRGESHPDTAMALNLVGDVHLVRGRHAEARACFESALESLRDCDATRLPDLAQVLNNLAAVSYRCGRYAEAEAAFREALDLRSRCLPPTHPSIAQGWNNVAAACARQGRHAEAEAMYLRALAMREAALGAKHPQLSDTLFNLGLLRLEQGRLDGATDYLARALAISAAARGDEHPETARIRSTLAEVAAGRGWSEEAEDLYRRVLDTRRERLGPTHPDVGRTLVGLAKVLRQRSRTDEATEAFEAALAIFEGALGTEHPDTENCREELRSLRC